MSNIPKGLVALGVAGAIASAVPMLAVADITTAPTNLSPSNGATLTTAQLTVADWGDVTGSSTPITYQYESSNSSSTNANGSFTSLIYQTTGLTSSSISIAGTAPGTYWWHVRAVDNVGSTSPWSMPFKLVVTATSSATTTPPTATTTPPNDKQQLISALLWLQGQHPSYYWNLQWVIDQLNNQGGTTTPPSGTASIDNPNRVANAGGAVDWVGRNFGAEETVNIMRGGVLVGTAHADGGGNFSTGSMPVPGVGTHTYTFTGVTSGKSATATLTVQ